MERVLLLNQSYEPISIIGWQKAVVLYTKEKVEILKEYDRPIRSKYVTINMPAVVRLLKAFRRPRKRVKFNRNNILARDRWKCQYCNKKFPNKELTYDHVVPRSQGGTTCWENIATCCIYCNSKKGSKSLREANMRLKKQPTRPDWVPIFSLALSRKTIPELWRDFCYWNE